MSKNLLGDEDAAGRWEDSLGIFGLEIDVWKDSFAEFAILGDKIASKIAITTLSTVQSSSSRRRGRLRSTAGTRSPVVTAGSATELATSWRWLLRAMMLW